MLRPNFVKLSQIKSGAVFQRLDTDEVFEMVEEYDGFGAVARSLKPSGSFGPDELLLDEEAQFQLITKTVNV